MVEYDKFKMVYYRITFPKSNIPKDVLGIFLQKFPRDFFITVQNTDFDVISTKAVSSNEQLLPRMYFIGKGGLYTYKDVGDEDLMVCETFQLDLK